MWRQTHQMMKRAPAMPVIPHGALRDGVVAVACEPAHLPGEVGFADEELRIGSVGGRIGDHVVHEDGNGGLLPRLLGTGRLSLPADREGGDERHS